MTAFRYNCKQSGECWLKRRWDSAMLGSAAEEADGRWPFPRRMSPGDLDGWMECNGRLLFLETKGLGAPIPTGQHRALTVLSQGNTVVVQECDPPSADAVVRWRVVRDGVWHEWQQGDRLERDRLIQRWTVWAERQSRSSD